MLPVVRPKTLVVTRPSTSRSLWVRRWMMMLACGLLGVNIIMGDRVPLHSHKLHLEAGSEHRRLEREIDRLQAATEQIRQQNERLREQARRLREDPRSDRGHRAHAKLGLIRPGEVVFLLTDEPPTRRLRTR